MNPLTAEWVQKAEGDFTTATRELRARRSPNFDAACFHSQQTAEKYLKAFLQEMGVSIPYTHNLLDLGIICTNMDPTFSTLDPHLKTLSGYAVRFRYPGETASREEGKDALNSAKIVRDFLREKLA